jgi:hypothetical protein
MLGRGSNASGRLGLRTRNGGRLSMTRAASWTNGEAALSNSAGLLVICLTCRAMASRAASFGLEAKAFRRCPMESVSREIYGPPRYTCHIGGLGPFPGSFLRNTARNAGQFEREYLAIGKPGDTPAFLCGQRKSRDRIVRYYLRLTIAVLKVPEAQRVVM